MDSLRTDALTRSRRVPRRRLVQHRGAASVIAGRAIRDLGVVSLLVGVMAGAVLGGAPAAAGPPSCWGAAATIDDHEGKILGTAGDDVIVGDDGINLINGNGGNDTICGEDGNDTINGGAGNDELYGFDGNDILTGGSGDDLLDGNRGDDTLDGGTGDDTLFGSDDDDLVRGGAGNDEVYGDGLYVVNGNDTLEGGDGDDHLVGDLGDDTLDGGDGEDSLLGDILGTDGTQGGADRLHGGNDDDELQGNDGDDQLFGNAGSDDLDGGAGTDFCAQDGRVLTACEQAFAPLSRADDRAPHRHRAARPRASEGTDRHSRDRP